MKRAARKVVNIRSTVLTATALLIATIAARADDRATISRWYSALLVADRTVKPLKPKASRDKSSETFLVGIGPKQPR